MERAKLEDERLLLPRPRGIKAVYVVDGGYQHFIHCSVRILLCLNYFASFTYISINICSIKLK